MKQKYLTAAIASIVAGSLIYSPWAFSVVDLDEEPNTDGVVTSASFWPEELKVDDSTSLLAAFDGATINGSSTTLNITGKFGFGFPASSTRFVRLELDNGAKFKETPICEVAGTGTASTTATCASRDGGAGQSFATYRFDTNTSTIAPTDTISFTVTDSASPPTKGGVIPAGNADINIRYTLHNNDVSADKPGVTGTGIIVNKQQKYVDFTPFFNVALTSSATATADVGTDFLRFTNGQLAAAIGGVSVSGGGTLYTNEFDASNVVVGNKTLASTDVIDAANLSITGDFTVIQDYVGTVLSGTYASATGRIFLTTISGSCSSPIGAINATSVSATEVIFSGIPTTGTAYTICIKPNGIMQISESDYSATVSFESKEGYDVPAVPSNGRVGRIVRNGTVLDTPYFTTNTGYISRIVFTNTGDKDANYTATIVSDAGNAVSEGAAVTGVIPANSNTVINASQLASFSGQTRGAVRFILGASNNEIQAVYQTVNLRSGDAQSILLNRRNGGDGQILSE